MPLVDLAARVAEHPDFRRPGALFYDGLHVTDAGSQVYAKLIAEALAARGAEPEPAVENPELEPDATP